MNYYVAADIHGFYSEFEQALENAGYFDDNSPHKLIICGDLFDRGGEANLLQSFICDLLSKDQVILIRGNHEDLAGELFDSFSMHHDVYSVGRHHISNGTFDTFIQLSDMTLNDVTAYPERMIKRVAHSPYFTRIIPSCIDYFETKNYIFVHGWIPCRISDYGHSLYDPEWRKVSNAEWHEARWTNGMLASWHGAVEPNKTIVCGHFHTSFGHCRADNTPEFGEGADFSPYVGDGIIAINACTAYSKRVNVLKISDEELTK